MRRFMPALVVTLCVLLASTGTLHAKGKGGGAKKDTTVTGDVQKRTASLISIHGDPGTIDRQYVLADTCVILVNSKEATIWDVMHGDTVTLTLKGGKVTKIEDNK